MAFKRLKMKILIRIKFAFFSLFILIGLTSFFVSEKEEFDYSIIANYYAKDKIQFAKGLWVKFNKNQNTFIFLSNSEDMFNSDTFSYLFLKNGDIFIQDVKQYSSKIGDTCACQFDFEYDQDNFIKNQCIVTNFIENFFYNGIKTSYYEMKSNISPSLYSIIKIVFDKSKEVPVFYENEIFRVGGMREMRIIFYLNSSRTP